jgi:hypothetical protein
LSKPPRVYRRIEHGSFGRPHQCRAGPHQIAGKEVKE